jgi:hypothetical protein
MKQLCPILLLALTLCANALTAQQHPPVFGSFKDSFEAATLENAPITPQVFERGGATLRLDSIVDYNHNPGGDSTLSGLSRFTYPSPGVTTWIRSYLNQTSNLFGEQFKYISVVDNLNRLVVQEYYRLENDSFVVLQRRGNYYQANAVSKLDSTTYESPSSDFGYVNKDYTYNAADLEIQRRNYSYNSSGSLSMREYNTSYLPDGKKYIEEEKDGTTLADLVTKARRVFEYIGDTIRTDYQLNNFDNTWTSSRYRFVRIFSQPGDVPAEEYYYTYYQPIQGLYLQSSWIYTFDTEGRIATEKFYSLNPSTQVATSNLYTFTYLQDNFYATISRYEIAPATGAISLFSRSFYYYSPVSGTQSPLRSPDAVRASPNPAEGSISLDAGKQDILSVEAYDATGRLLLRQSASGTSALLQVSDLPRGLLTLRVQLPSGVVAKQVLLN